ncbi:gas vesicle protein [Streptomyces kurssanovii]|nr:gas vesicle protein [Streptomyces kurssanovii]
MAVYVYSITAEDHPVRLDGVEGVGEEPAELRKVVAGSLCAVVSDAPDGLRPKRRDVMAHQAVQERLMADGAVLPLRFGLTAPDDDAVRDALEQGSAQYTQRIEAVRGCAEYNLKASQDEDAILREILLESETARELNDRIRRGEATPDMPVQLGELVAGEVQARQEALASGVIEALRPHSREVSTAQPTGEDFLNVSFLVAEDQEELFLATQLSVTNQLGEGYTFRLSGPLPPYSFV